MRRNLYRLSAIVLAALISAVAVVPTPASAAPAKTNELRGEIPCPADPNIRWVRTLIFLIGYQYSNINATSTFFASDGRVVENTTDQTVSATFTAAQTVRAEIELTRQRWDLAEEFARTALASHRRTGHRPGENRARAVLDMVRQVPSRR